MTGHLIGGGDALSQTSAAPLLGADEPPPWTLENPDGASDVLFVCEHAGAQMPAALGTLGLDPEHLRRHFIWDIGALDLARALAERFDAPLAHQRYSRMVCDCNRLPDVASFIPADGEGVPVPGNRDLTPEERLRRRRAIWQPFHDALARLLDAREAAARATVLVSVHSFTPVFFGTPRPWHVGVLVDRDPLFSHALHAALRTRLDQATVGLNEPYVMGQGVDYTIPVHAEDRALPCAEIELRNDLIGDAEGVAHWCTVLAAALDEARDALAAAAPEVEPTAAPEVEAAASTREVVRDAWSDPAT